MKFYNIVLLTCLALLLTGCLDLEGPPGAAGQKGAKGDPGAPGKDAAQVSGSRLRARYIVGADGSRQFLGDWFDPATDAPCAFSQSDAQNYGEAYCLPAAYDYFNVAYIDAGCTAMVLWTPYEYVPPTYGRPTGEPDRVVKTSGLVDTPAALYDVVSGWCESYVPPLPLTEYVFYSAEEVELSFFVPGTVVD